LPLGFVSKQKWAGVYEKIEVDVLPVPPFWLAIEITIGRQLNQKPVAGFFGEFLY
jgi:hypothetical protein